MPPAVTETNEARPLSDEERRALRDLMARENAWATPATRVGEPYVALVNLSVPRRGDKDRQTDLVHAGETVYLTDEEARLFNRRGNRDGRQVDVVRKLSGPDGSRGEIPRILPRAVSGRLFRPPVPEPGSGEARPDPEGSSRVQVIEDGRAPEVDGAMSADPSEMADTLRSAAAADAMDLPPRGARARRGQ
ncbi:MAG TPA: hypothetical protein VL551_21335 [Actinospica sp.]|jgi:hypothetical protein|nr:hypothetical protein [Actinospica sp.]